jgi:hypothetical protein
MVQNGDEIPERHLRPLVPLEPEQQRKVYAEVVEEVKATGQPITAKKVARRQAPSRIGFIIYFFLLFTKMTIIRAARSLTAIQK